MVRCKRGEVVTLSNILQDENQNLTLSESRAHARFFGLTETLQHIVDVSSSHTLVIASDR